MLFGFEQHFLFKKIAQVLEVSEKVLPLHPQSKNKRVLRE